MPASRKWLILVGFLLTLALGLSAYYIGLKANTPPFNGLLTQVEIPIVLASGEKSTRRIGPTAPGWVPLEMISPNLVHAIISQEDTSFFSHSGVDLHEVKQAIKEDLEKGRYARGASTITQQVVKNVFLSRKKSLIRKLKEFVWAQEMEKTLSKQAILNFYLNMVELGPGIYGVGEATQYYFGINTSEISLRQAAFIALLLPSPRRYHNAYFVKKSLSAWATKRINRTLKVMYKMSFISEADYERALQEQIWSEEAVETESSNLPEADPEVGTEPYLKEALPEENEASAEDAGEEPEADSETENKTAGEEERGEIEESDATPKPLPSGQDENPEIDSTSENASEEEASENTPE